MYEHGGQCAHLVECVRVLSLFPEAVLALPDTRHSSTSHHTNTHSSAQHDNFSLHVLHGGRVQAYRSGPCPVPASEGRIGGLK